jgi:hypothetical protein
MSIIEEFVAIYKLLVVRFVQSRLVYPTIILVCRLQFPSAISEHNYEGLDIPVFR